MKIPLVLLFLCSLNVGAFAEEYSLRVPEPSWIAKSTPEYSIEVDEPDVLYGKYYLVDEKQVNVRGAGIEEYTHIAYRVMNSTGLAVSGTISITFNPSFQSLRIHSIRIVRKGLAIDAVPKAKISLLQREEGLEYSVYRGTKTLNAILEDVRVDDVVEYSYTIAGQQPSFKGRFFDFWAFPEGATVRRALYRVTASVSRDIRYKVFAGAGEPRVTVSAGIKEMVWEMKDLNLEYPDDTVPAWYNTTPEIQISEFDSWREVADWALPLYEGQLKADPEVKKLAEELVSGVSSVEDRIVALISYVQDDIRYVGIETGISAYAPNPPRSVIQRRFGDCKDKAVLLTALCRAIGVEAFPVLVNTYVQSHVEEYLPSPLDFDHVITLIVHDGLSYWIDPTISDQHGSLDTRAQARDGSGLVIRESTYALTSIEPAARQGALVSVRETYDISAGQGIEGTLRIESTYRDSMADSYRSFFATTGRAQVQKNYLSYYSSLFDDIEAADALDVSDDEKANVLVVSESYTIPDPWRLDAGSGKYVFDIYPEDLRSYLSGPGDPRRTTPYAISHPVDIVVTKTVALPPAPWSLKGQTFTVDDPAFRFERSSEYAENTYTCRFEYVTSKDHVMPEEMEKYAEDLDSIDKAVNITLSYNGRAARPAGSTPAEGSGSPSPIIPALILIVAAFLGLVAVMWLVRRIGKGGKKSGQISL
jgi:transglutaminase-like putative cysteine protease